MESQLLTAWAAGLFEGEGTFGHRKLVDGSKSPSDMRLTMIDEDVVRRFADYAGFGNVYIKSTPDHPNHRPQWTWVGCGKQEMAALCSKLIPYLGERRAEKAQWVIDQSSRINRTNDR